MIEIVAHCGDVHIHKDTRLEEYRQVFDTFYNKLRELNPDRIVVNGDTWNDWVELKSDGFLLLGEFLNKLSHISKVIVTLGNHDFTKKNLNKTDTIKAVTTLLDNNNIIYYDKTGFYNDENVVWSVWGHADRGNPWKDFPITKDKTKTYIDLYHDPIDKVKLYNGTTYTKSNIPSIKDLKGDISMLNDIHLFQSFENGTKAYSSSLIQQNWGEDPINHGFLNWSISNKNFEFINIPNDHGFINLYINEMTDYGNLNLTAPIFKDSEVKVHWKDYSSNITTVNEKNIRDYIKEKFNTIKIKFEKTHVYTDVISSEMLSESLDLTDLKVQTTVFKEYLQEQKYKKDDVEEILKIDEIINSRLNLSSNKTNIEWSIDKFWFNNFKSYGDNNEIDWKDIDGIIQISAFENQEGKTTILDAITYILFGKTTTTLSPEKFGDSRYINNKRNLDYCFGGAVIDVNGEKFTIQRKTERVWNKNKTLITSCPTTLDYYKTEEISEKNKLTGEVKKKTQDKLDLILGDMKDFVRLSFTNADNLDDSLSETRSVFMDNIIRDAGYDVFETKLEEFKEYKKELSEEKLIVDIQDSESQIEDLKIENDGGKQNIETNQALIDEFERELKRHGVDRDDLNKRLNNIDSSMVNFDENINLNSIKNYESKIAEYTNVQLTILDREISILPKIFDPTKINNLKVKLKDTNDKILERKDEIFKMRELNTEQDKQKDKILSKIKELKDSEIKKFQLKISDNEKQIEIIKSKKENIINDEVREITSQIQKLELEKSDISNKMKLLQKDGLNLKNSNDQLDIDIEKLKNSTACPSCGRAYDKNDPEYSDHLAHLEEQIKEKTKLKEDNNVKIQKFLSDYKILKNKLPELEEKENILNSEKDNIRDGIFSDETRIKLKEVGSAKNTKQENLDIKVIIEEIKNNNFQNTQTLKDNIAKGTLLLKNVEKEKGDNQQVILNIESELKSFNLEGIENDIEIEEKLRSNFELRKQKISQKDNILLTIENFNLKIKDLKYELDKYQEYKYKIEENKNIQFSINRIDEKILIVKDSIKELQDETSEIEKEIIINEKEIETISNKITKYLKQKKKEELLKEYQKCISRDGIPTFLLKKSIHLINRELTEILANVDFTLFFDENLVLKMSADDRLDVSQNAIESSGKERTFCALALKMALREVNVKSKPKFIFMDELTGKLVNKSIQQFVDFIEGLKTKIKKIVIIEHHNYINFDAIISVKKDEKLISSLEMTL